VVVVVMGSEEVGLWGRSGGGVEEVGIWGSCGPRVVTGGA